MPTKDEIFDLLDSREKTTYTKGEVKSFVTSVSTTHKDAPRLFRKGDVIINGVGAKKRPCVVIKVADPLLWVIPLSTTEDELNLCESTSRFFQDGFFSMGVYAMTIEYAKDNFEGVYDNNKALNNAIKLMKEIVSGL